MELRLERPSAPGEYESWATIMERVSGDVTNAGMRGVNARLGYRPAPVRSIVSGPLAT